MATAHRPLLLIRGIFLADIVDAVDIITNMIFELILLALQRVLPIEDFKPVAGRQKRGET